MSIHAIPSKPARIIPLRCLAEPYAVQPQKIAGNPSGVPIACVPASAVDDGFFTGFQTGRLRFDSHYRVPRAKVSHASGLPVVMPLLNHSTRWADDPCVNRSGATWPVDMRWRRSSPIAAAAIRPSSTSPGSSSTLPGGGSPGLCRGVTPYTRETVGLQLQRDRSGVCRTGPTALRGAQAFVDPEQMLDVVPDLMREHVGTGEFPRRAKMLLELVKEPEVEIHALVRRAVERSGRRLSRSAGGVDAVAEQHDARGLIAASQHAAPRVLHVLGDRPDEIHRSLFGRCCGRRDPSCRPNPTPAASCRPSRGNRCPSPSSGEKESPLHRARAEHRPEDLSLSGRVRHRYCRDLRVSSACLSSPSGLPHAGGCRIAARV